MSGLVLATDVSVFGGGVIRSRCKRAKRDHGLGLAIAELWTGRTDNFYANSTLGVAHVDGMMVAGRAVLNDLPGAMTISLARRACESEIWEALRFVALGVEMRGVTAKTVADAAEAVQADGLRPIIHTSRWFWAGRLGNPDWASHLPLWHSDYDGKDTLRFPKPYGGWTCLAGKQYQDANTLLNFSSELSVFDEEWLSPTVEEAEKQERGWPERPPQETPTGTRTVARIRGHAPMRPFRAGLT